MIVSYVISYWVGEEYVESWILEDKKAALREFNYLINKLKEVPTETKFRTVITDRNNKTTEVYGLPKGYYPKTNEGNMKPMIEVANELGIKYQRLYNRARDGNLYYRREGKTLLVNEDEVIAWRKEVDAKKK